MTKDLVGKNSNLPKRPASTMNGLARALDSDQDAELMETVAMGEDLLMELGVVGMIDTLPEAKEGENIGAYIARVWDDLGDDVQAHVEVRGISRMVSLGKVGEKAVQQRLYRQFVTGTWEVYAQQVGINWYRDYVYYVLREAHGLKDSKAGRWADALYVIGWMYQIPNQYRYGIEFIDLPPTAQVAILSSINRLGRVAARLIHLIAEVDSLNVRINFNLLTEMRDQGLIDPEDINDRAPSTRLLRKMLDVRHLLFSALGGKASQGELDQMASGSTREVPKIQWPEDVPITLEQRNLLEDKLGDSVSFGVPEGLRAQYKMELIPMCPACHQTLFVLPYTSMTCDGCLQEYTSEQLGSDDYDTLWFRRQESDAGMTKWEKCDSPHMKGWHPEQVEVAGITATIFNVVEET